MLFLLTTLSKRWSKKLFTKQVSSVIIQCCNFLRFNVSDWSYLWNHLLLANLNTTILGITLLVRNHGIFMKGVKFHHDSSYLKVFHIHEFITFPKALCFFSCSFFSHSPSAALSNSSRIYFSVNSIAYPANPNNLFLFSDDFLLLTNERMLENIFDNHVRPHCPFLPPTVFNTNNQPFVTLFSLSFLVGLT